MNINFYPERSRMAKKVDTCVSRGRTDTLQGLPEREWFIKSKEGRRMKRNVICAAVLFMLMTGAVQASAHSRRMPAGDVGYGREVSGMLSELGKRLEGRVPAEKVRKKFSSLSGDERALILLLYKRMKGTESGPGREIAISLIMALLVLS